ncbi:MAG: hypothetical protein ACYCPT_01995 [Acidimicrobiales bacterium]
MADNSAAELGKPAAASLAAKVRRVAGSVSVARLARRAATVAPSMPGSGALAVGADTAADGAWTCLCHA